MNTCPALIPDGGRAVTFHTCGRKLSGSEDYPELCGLHAAAKRRALARKRDREQTAARASNEMRAAEDRVATAARTLGIAASAQTRSDVTSFRAWPTGCAVIKIEDLEALAARIRELEFRWNTRWANL